MNRAAVAAVLLIGLTGCFQPERSPVSGSFDGEGAYWFVEDFMELGAARVPGHEDHDAAAESIAGWMDVSGWNTRTQTFSGDDYLAQDAGAVSAYHGGPWCTADDKQDLENLRFHNLIASWPVEWGPTWILGAHWDIKEEANRDPDPERRMQPVPGANDGASGAGVLLQLMRHIAAGDIEPSVGITIVLFDGEDGFEDCHPLAGSIHHASSVDGGIDQMVLLDMVGDPEGRFVKEELSVDTSPALVDKIWAAAATVGDDRFLAGDRTCKVLDDHVPYAERGIPALDIIDYGRGSPCGFSSYWHTSGDTLDNITSEALDLIGEVLALVLSD